MKRLMIITTSYPDLIPGSEAAGAFVADFAEALSHHVRVSVVAPSQAEGVVRRENLNVHRFAVPSLPLSLLSPLTPRHWPRIGETLRAGHRTVHRLTAEEKIDHLLALWALPSGFWARSAGKKYGIPYSVWALGSDIWSLGRIPLVRSVLRSVLRDSRVAFADGCLLREDVERIAGRPCGFLPSSRRLSPGREKQYARYPPYRLAFLGRWHVNKGADILLSALGLLDEDDWQRIYEVRICGGGPLEGEMRQSCAELRRAGRPVSLGGYLDKEEAAELLLWADYLLIPSRIESIPVVFSDALQAGCPVIAAPAGDLPRLLADYEVGILAQKAEASSFARAIGEALARPPASFARGLNQATQIFDLDRAVGTFLEKAGIY